MTCGQDDDNGCPKIRRIVGDYSYFQSYCFMVVNNYLTNENETFQAKRAKMTNPPKPGEYCAYDAIYARLERDICPEMVW